jgi:hypothetical protein
VTRPVRVTPDDLRRHAGHLDAVADELDTARQAGNATRPGTDAYGQLCTLVPAMLGQLQAPLVEAIGAAAESVRDTADALVRTASNYEFIDQKAAETLRDSGGGR